MVAEKIIERIKKSEQDGKPVHSLGFAPDDGLPMDHTPETMKNLNQGFTDWLGREGVTTELSISEEWLTFMNRVAEHVCRAYPDFILTSNGYTNLALHGEVDLDAEIRAWWKRHFSGELPDGVKEVFLSFEDFIEKALYINGTNITEYNPDPRFSAQGGQCRARLPGLARGTIYETGHAHRRDHVPHDPAGGHKWRPAQELRQEKLDAIATAYAFLISCGHTNAELDDATPRQLELWVREHVKRIQPLLKVGIGMRL